MRKNSEDRSMGSIEKTNLLIIDDNPGKIIMLESILNSLDINIISVTSGVDGLRKLLSEDFACILLDVNMPIMDGYETAQMIRSREKSEQIPIIFISAVNQTATDVFKGYSSGAVDYIFTPISPEILLAKVKVFIELNNNKRELETKTKELKKLNEELDDRVKERTLEVADAHLLNKSILESVGEGIYGLDLEGNSTFVNKAAADMLGYTKEELYGVCMHVNHHKADSSEYPKVECPVNAVFIDEVSCMVTDEVFWRKDGSSFSVEYTSTPLRNEQNEMTGAVVVFKDITERKKADDELKKMLLLIEEKNKELQDFLYIASHDLQEPLRKVQGFGDLLKKKFIENLGETGADYINRMQSASARMQKLIDALLIYSRVTTKAKPFEQVNLNEIVEDIVSEYDNLLEKADAKIVIEKLPVIQADEFQLSQVFHNLISNAIKFRKEEAPLEIKIYQVDEDHVPKEYIQIVVEDNGIGIDEKYSNKVFEVFEKLHDKQKYEGTGMGLAICRKIVERHGGTITFKSKPGEGTLFILNLLKINKKI
jgi:PAS domain S-box-containing protein